MIYRLVRWSILHVWWASAWTQMSFQGNTRYSKCRPKGEYGGKYIPTTCESHRICTCMPHWSPILCVSDIFPIWWDWYWWGCIFTFNFINAYAQFWQPWQQIFQTQVTVRWWSDKWCKLWTHMSVILHSMAQLVESFKKHTFKNPLTDTPLSNSAAFEEAVSFKTNVTNFLQDLPAAFKLDIDANRSTQGALLSSTPWQFSVTFPTHLSLTACVVAQQCELIITGQQLILKSYLPFLRPNHTTSALSANHNQAALGTINAAHAIIHASRALHGLCEQPCGATSKWPGPSIFAYYSFG